MKIKKIILIWIVGMILLSGLANSFSGLGTGVPSNPFIITTCLELNETRDESNSYYELGNDVDCSDTVNWDNGKGFDPVDFGGNFNGKNYKINNLFINRSSETYVGLFGLTTGTIQYLGVEQATVTGHASVGLLVGSISGNIYECYATGNVNGTGGNYAGGLIGAVDTNGVVSNSYFIGNVTSTGIYAGGFTALNKGVINNSFSNANVTHASWNTGGFVGGNNGNISNSYSFGSVKSSGSQYVGGFSGNNQELIEDSYSIVDVSGASATGVGGFSGYNYGGINRSFSTGNVSGNLNVGAFVGYSGSSGDYVTNVYWYNTAGNPASCRGGGSGDFDCTAKTELDYFKNSSNEPITSWDFDYSWSIDSAINNGFPYHKWEDLPNYLDFTVDSTNFLAVDDITNVSDAKIGNSYGYINWNNNINAKNADFDNNVVITTSLVGLNASNLNQTMNSSAEVRMIISGCLNEGAYAYKIYYSPNYHTTLEGLLNDSEKQECVSAGICSDVKCSGNGVLTFNVSHFDSFGGSGGIVPEFSTITLMLALVIVIGGFFKIRNKQMIK